MAGTPKVTSDHKKIRKWAEERKGQPASVKGTGSKNDAGLLRINFPGYKEASLENISWEEFFVKFDEKKLAFLYQEKTASGRTSRFFKIVDQETAKNVRKRQRPAAERKTSRTNKKERTTNSKKNQ